MIKHCNLKEGNGVIAISQFNSPLSKQNPFHHELHYEIIGNIHSKTIIIQGGISSSKHTTSSVFNQEKGWWENIVGRGKAIDLEEFCVLSIDYLDFNGVTTYDQARAIHELILQLNIENIDSFIGYSYGGMVALAFGELFPNIAQHIIALGASYESVPQSFALRLIQQKIVELNMGTSNEKEALEVARKLGIITYRSSEELNSRFNEQQEGNSIMNYLDKKGKDFSSIFSAEKFLSLSKSINFHKINPNRIGAKKVSLICCKSDQITPLFHVKKLSKKIKCPTIVYEIDSIFGHDSYLNETTKISILFNKIFNKK
jgi:homoserine O-acetyltransferase/O-succinyltransferase